uniref:Uncharacterized protein n=1 Tax=Streptomyces sp. NBC_00003 TaxID=2903608 RepID=A0AAU2UXB9_9ACTN
MEHDLDVIKHTDWFIDIGPDAGQRGGQVVFTGTPHRHGSLLPHPLRRPPVHGTAPPVEGEERQEAGQVVDLMAALNASVEKAKAGRGENIEGAVVHDLPKKRAATATAEKTAAKKTTATKTTGKRTVAKKTTGRKPRSA